MLKRGKKDVRDQCIETFLCEFCVEYIHGDGFLTVFHAFPQGFGGHFNVRCIAAGRICLDSGLYFGQKNIFGDNIRVQRIDEGCFKCKIRLFGRTGADRKQTGKQNNGQKQCGKPFEVSHLQYLPVIFSEVIPLYNILAYLQGHWNFFNGKLWNLQGGLGINGRVIRENTCRM